MLPYSDISNLGRQFEIMVANHTCQLEHDELKEPAASAGLIHLTSKDCHQMIKEININGSHTISNNSVIETNQLSEVWPSNKNSNCQIL
jgi:hypothetical protein